MPGRVFNQMEGNRFSVRRNLPFFRQTRSAMPKSGLNVARGIWVMPNTAPFPQGRTKAFICVNLSLCNPSRRTFPFSAALAAIVPIKTSKSTKPQVSRFSLLNRFNFKILLIPDRKVIPILVLIRVLSNNCFYYCSNRYYLRSF